MVFCFPHKALVVSLRTEALSAERRIYWEPVGVGVPAVGAVCADHHVGRAAVYSKQSAGDRAPQVRKDGEQHENGEIGV